MEYPDMIQAFAGLGLLALGRGLGFLLSYQLKRGVLPQVEREAEDRVRQQLAEEECAVRLSLLEERDNWYKTKARQEAELEDQLADLNRRDKSLAQLVRDLNTQKEEQSRAWSRLKNQERRIDQREQILKEEERELGPDARRVPATSRAGQRATCGRGARTDDGSIWPARSAGGRRP